MDGFAVIVEKKKLNETADALSTLQSENAKLRVELEKVKVERDAAIKDINGILSHDEFCGVFCKFCKWDKDCDEEKVPEWRGRKED